MPSVSPRRPVIGIPFVGRVRLVVQVGLVVVQVGLVIQVGLLVAPPVDVVKLVGTLANFVPSPYARNALKLVRWYVGKPKP